jgi:hypothetical protein
MPVGVEHVMTLEQVRAAKEPAAEVFGRLAEVVGVGITRIEGDYALKVNLRSEPPEGVQLPDQIDGVPVRVEVVGTVRKQ